VKQTIQVTSEEQSRQLPRGEKLTPVDTAVGFNLIKFWHVTRYDPSCAFFFFLDFCICAVEISVRLGFGITSLANW
jgi:hypothetical protein